MVTSEIFQHISLPIINNLKGVLYKAPNKKAKCRQILPKLAQIKRGSLNSFAGAKQNALACTPSMQGQGENKQRASLTHWPCALFHTIK